MATTSFDKTFIIETEESLQHLINAIEHPFKARPPLFTDKERERSDALLEVCFTRYKG